MKSIVQIFAFALFVFIVSAGVVMAQGTVIHRYESVCPGETGEHTFMDTLFYENFESGDISCWISNAGRNSQGIAPRNRVCLREDRSQCINSYGRFSAMEEVLYTAPTSNPTALQAYMSTLITPQIPIVDPSQTTISFLFFNDEYQYQEWNYDPWGGYDYTEMIWRDEIGLMYINSATSTVNTLWCQNGEGCNEVWVTYGSWTRRNMSLRGQPSGNINIAFAHVNEGGTGVGWDEILIMGPRRVSIPPQVTNAAPGTTLETQESYYRIGCTPTTVITHWYVKPETQSETTIFSPGGYTWNGQYYTTSGTYTYNNGGRLRNADGCDSTAILHLVIDVNNAYHDYQVACDSYQWNGNTYTSSAEDSVKCYACNQWGGDSTTYLHLTINHSATITIDSVSCLPMDWQGQTHDSSFVNALHLYTNVGHCDSIVTMRFMRHFPDETFVIDTACDDETYYFAGAVLDHSGDFTARLRNIYLCDSTVHLNLSYFPAYHFPPMVDTVDREELPYTGYFEITGENYTYELHNELIHFRALGGCDSNYHLTLIIRYNLSECDTGLQFPNVITPNGDNHNDRFYIAGLENGCWPENELIIYNRWGGRVFSLRNMKSGMDCWEPTYMPAGTYYYRFQARNFKGTTERFGVVEVIK